MTDRSSLTELAQGANAAASDVTDYLEALPPDGWRQPSDCAGWTISAVVGHLVLVEALLGSSIARGLQGDAGPPPQAAGGVEDWRAWRTAEINRLSELPPAELRAQFAAGLERMQEPLGRLTAGEGANAQGWHPMGAQPLTWFPGQWLVELALHDWDMRVASDPQAEINQAAQPSLGEQMRQRMPRCCRPEPADLAGRVRIRLDGPAETAWVARLAGDRLDLEADQAEGIDATIATDPGTYALVQTGRRPSGAFADRGRWRVEGDGALANRLAQSFTGY